MPEFLVRAKATPSPTHGQDPHQRPVPDLVRLGCIVLDKPKGPSSHQVAAWVRDLFGLDKAGHGGTLDPNVTGVLPIALADATKALSTIKDLDKAYVGVVHFHHEVERKDLEAAMSEFTGDIYQRPPLRSAVKRELRIRRVDTLELLEFDGRNALIRVDCQGGTYVRKIADDLGLVLGTGAHLNDLRRVRSAHVTEADAVTLHDVKDAWEEWKEHGRDDWLREAVRPVEDLVGHLPQVLVRDTAVDAVCHGAPLGLPGVLQADRRIARGDTVLLATLKGEAIALARADMPALQMMVDETGVAARPERTIMAPGTYPKGW